MEALNIKDKYKKRIVDAQIDKGLKIIGAINLVGPKWCGKTWAGIFHTNSAIYLNDPSNNYYSRTIAMEDPLGVLEGEKPRLIDEWQDVQKLWDAVRFVIDRSHEPGQFLLTESATPKQKKKGNKRADEIIHHSGAGRIMTIKMRTMSLYEAGFSSGQVSLKDLCYGNFEPCTLPENISIDKIVDVIMRGGWPNNLENDLDLAIEIPKSYIAQVLEKDIYEIDDLKRDKSKFLKLMKSLARNESTTVSNSVIAKDIDIDKMTVSDYTGVLENLNLLANQQPYSSNVRSSVRIKQSVKRHFTDPSLTCALLGLEPQMLAKDLQTLGFIFEALVERDLDIYASSFNAKLYHYQDYRNNEIDAVIELADGSWCAFEIKLGTTQIDEAAKNLIKIRDEILNDEKGKPPILLCIISGLVKGAYKREDGVFVLPAFGLKH